MTTDYGYGSNAELAPKFSVKTKISGSVGGGMGSTIARKTSPREVKNSLTLIKTT